MGTLATLEWMWKEKTRCRLRFHSFCSNGKLSGRLSGWQLMTTSRTLTYSGQLVIEVIGTLSTITQHTHLGLATSFWQLLRVVFAINLWLILGRLETHSTIVLHGNQLLLQLLQLVQDDVLPRRQRTHRTLIVLKRTHTTGCLVSYGTTRWVYKASAQRATFPKPLGLPF